MSDLIRQVTLLIFCFGLAHFASGEDGNSDWAEYLGGKERNLFSPFQQINRENVSQLAVAWTYDTDEKAEYKTNNLIVDGVLYTPTRIRGQKYQITLKEYSYLSVQSLRILSSESKDLLAHITCTFHLQQFGNSFSIQSRFFGKHRRDNALVRSP